jgi:tetratricopeptide (TPR) repeat protein
MVTRALLVVLLLAGVAYGQDPQAVQKYLFAASRLYQTLEYERALEQLKRARAASSGVADDAAIARYEGVVLFDMGKRDDALAAFREALYLEPDATLPLKVSPKISEAFEAARVKVKRELAPVLEKRKAEEEAKQEAARKLAQQNVAQTEAARAEAARVEAARVEAARVEAARVEAARASDAPRDPLLTPPDPPGAAIVTAPKPVPVTPLVLGGVALVSGGLAAVFGVLTGEQLTAARAATFQVDTIAALQRAQTPALVTNIALAVSGTTAVAALIAWLAGAP